MNTVFKRLLGKPGDNESLPSIRRHASYRFTPRLEQLEDRRLLSISPNMAPLPTDDMLEANSPPALQTIPDQSISHSQDSFDVVLTAGDADGDALNYTVELSSTADLAYQLDQSYGLYRHREDYSLNYRGYSEKYLRGDNVSHYFILPSGDFYAWGGSIASSTLLASLGSEYYADPTLLHEAPPASIADQVTTSLSGNTLTIDPAGDYAGTFQVAVTVDDGLDTATQTFNVAVTNDAPQLQPLPDRAMSHNQDSLDVVLTAGDADGDALNYTVELSSTADLAYQLDQSYGLYRHREDYSVNYRGHSEKYLRGDNVSHYFILPGGDLYAWGGSIASSTLLASLGSEYYADPTLLHEAPPASIADQVTTSLSGNTLTIDPAGDYAGTFQVAVTVDDGLDTATQTFNVAVTNDAPQLQPLPDRAMSHNQDSLDVVLTASDGDGDALGYTVELSSTADVAYQLDQSYGLYRHREDYSVDYRGYSEKYLRGDNVSHYFILPGGDFYAWGGSIASSTLLASLGSEYYADPTLLHEAPPASIADQVATSLSGNILTIDPASDYAGTFQVAVTVDDGLDTATQTFNVAVTNDAPQLQPLPDRAMSHNQDSLDVVLTASDGDGDALGYTVELSSTADVAYQLDQSYGLYRHREDYSVDYRGYSEKYLRGDNVSHYFILPGGDFYAWGGSIASSTLLASLGSEYYADPTLLHEAPPASIADQVATSLSGNILTIDPASDYAGTFQVAVTVDDGSLSISETFSVTVIGAQSSAVISTDQQDYLPGSWAIISGEGFQIGETVQLQVLHIDGTPNTGEGHEPWLVTDGGDGDLDLVADGNIQTQWYVATDDSLGSTFQLTALGLSSGEMAATTFTDADVANRLKSHTVWDSTQSQYEPGNPSGYAEGDTASFLVEIETLNGDDFTGGPLEFTFQIELDLDNDPYAFTDIEPYDTTFTPTIPGTVPVALSDTDPDLGVVSVFTPADNSITVDITSVTYLGVDNGGPIPFQTWEVTFTIDAAADAGEVFFVYGGHIAEAGDPLPSIADGGPGGTVPAPDPDSHGASGISGTFQARVDPLQGGDKTVNFKGTDIILEPATKSGTKFHDLNADGDQDVGEPGLIDWQIHAYADDGDGVLEQDEYNAGPAATTTTGADGSYSFDLSPGDYIVVELLQDGWFQSLPSAPSVLDDTLTTTENFGDFGYAITLTSGGLDPGNDFGNFQQATKSGTKFHDLNGNGTQDTGELGLVGWTINIEGTDGMGGTVSTSTVTDADGNYTIDLDPGTYTVYETLESDWFQSFPQAGTGIVTAPNGTLGYEITLQSGDTDTGNDFGNFQQATKSGTKFHDLNANGTQDTGELGLVGWTINIEGTDGMGGTVSTSTVTDGDGNYTIDLDPGTYTVFETLETAWFQSFPQAGTGIVTAPNGTLGYEITLQSGDTDTGNDFGNFQQATKSGTKFHDLNGNGTQDTGELGLAGWTINIEGTDGMGGTVSTSTVTDADGNYTIDLDPGTYTVFETLETAWFQSFPQAGTGIVTAPNGTLGYEITLQSGDTDTGNDFGNFQQATKSGTKFHDLNGNGTQDTGELGLAGWTINIEGTDGMGGTVSTSTVTDADGNYTIDLDPGTYTVFETLETAWFQSFPQAGTGIVTAPNGTLGYEITLQSGDTDTGNDFGNFQQATKSGTKFHDLNGNGTQDAGELGLVGWTINAYADDGDGVLEQAEYDAGTAATDTTDGSGNYSLSLDPGDYVVVEVLQNGWFQSLPGAPSVLDGGLNTGSEILGSFGYAITLESDELDDGNDFGNFQQPTKSGTKFHDLNADGTQDTGELGLAGWTIRAYADDGDGVLEQTEYDAGSVAAASTSSDGSYALMLDPGDYIVVEILQNDWFQSLPGAPSVLDAGLNTGGETLGSFGYAVTLQSGGLEDGNDFGNFQQATKSGRKFNDLQQDGFTGDGVNDDSDPGLEDWEIRVYADDGAGEPSDAEDGRLSDDEFAAGPVATDFTDADGNYSFTLDPGFYIVVEVIQDDWSQTFPAGPGIVDAATDELGLNGYAVTLVSGVDELGNDFGNFFEDPNPPNGDGSAIVIGADKGRYSEPYVMVVDKDTGEVLSKFLAYESSYRGGVRVAAGDLTGDGIDEIITAPGRVHAPEVRVFSQDGTELTQFRFLAYDAPFTDGVQIGVGDVDGDGMNDIVTIPTDNAAAQVKVFRNEYDSLNPDDDPISDTPYRSFLAFPSNFIGGGVVRVADMGTFLDGAVIDATAPDGKGEIIVGNGPGMRSTVKVFDATASEPKVVRTFLPFSSSFRGGVSIDLGLVNGDLIPDLMVGTGNGGGSKVEVLDGRFGTLLNSFFAYTDASRNSPVRVAVQDDDQVITAQGTDGKTREIRCFDALSGALADTIFENDEDFYGQYFIDVIDQLAQIDELF